MSTGCTNRDAVPLLVPTSHPTSLGGVLWKEEESEHRGCDCGWPAGRPSDMGCLAGLL